MKTDEDLQAELYELCKNRQGKWANEHDFGGDYINKVCNGKEPMTETLAAILGYERPRGWVKRKPK